MDGSVVCFGDAFRDSEGIKQLLRVSKTNRDQSRLVEGERSRLNASQAD
jgi:hypothetical protein